MIINDINFRDVNPLQITIMQFVDKWVHEQKTPVPHKEIMGHTLKIKINSKTAYEAIQMLLKKGYIRKAIVVSNKRFYVQLRRV